MVLNSYISIPRVSSTGSITYVRIPLEEVEDFSLRLQLTPRILWDRLLLTKI